MAQPIREEQRLDLLKAYPVGGLHGPTSERTRSEAQTARPLGAREREAAASGLNQLSETTQ